MTRPLLPHPGPGVRPDGHIRPPEILAAVDWSKQVFRALDDLFRPGDSLPLSAINQDTATGRELHAACRRLLDKLGRPEADTLCLADVAGAADMLAKSRFNGDGVLPPERVDDEPLRKAVVDIIAGMGGKPDASGLTGVDQATVDKFFESMTAMIGWFDQTGKDPIENPISIRQAFWAPYKRFVRMIEEQVAKRAAAADEEAKQKVQVAATQTAQADKAKQEPAAEKQPEAKKIDVGTVAAIGVAVAGIATFFSSILATFMGLGMWMPLGLLALLLAISGPSMLIAWLKLRQRNVGPILDANGWSVNALAKINIPFGTALTKVAALPRGSQRQMRDPFAPRRPPYGLYTILLLLVGMAALWTMGHLDSYLPTRFKCESVLGREPLAETTQPVR